ncbi:hypothetical protein SAMN04488511_11059 [Pedobacter suwonensis]|uniref:Uncharacterized protein n=1 Tax=Pedobacter suwonensis TaxID=332999 RepID=A0A1I0TIB5_9SPHI|nr:hypothetical protein SAMN04488511_11059 [Pedobacter suwonensis]
MQGLLLIAKWAKLFAKGAIVFLPQRKRSFTQSGFYVYAWFIINRKVRRGFRKGRYCAFTTEETEFSQRAKNGFVCILIYSSHAKVFFVSFFAHFAVKTQNYSMKPTVPPTQSKSAL